MNRHGDLGKRRPSIPASVLRVLLCALPLAGLSTCLCSCKSSPQELFKCNRILVLLEANLNIGRHLRKMFLPKTGERHIAKQCTSLGNTRCVFQALRYQHRAPASLFSALLWTFILAVCCCFLAWYDAGPLALISFFFESVRCWVWFFLIAQLSRGMYVVIFVYPDQQMASTVPSALPSREMFCRSSSVKYLT